MENLIKIIKIASKKLFKTLKNKSPYYCSSLDKNIFITNIFYKHISGYSKNRKTREIIERLSILSLIEEILLNGNIFQKREKVYYEKYNFYKKTYKISHNIEGIYFIVLIGEKQNGKHLILSCFVKNPKKNIIKKD